RVPDRRAPDAVRLRARTARAPAPGARRGGRGAGRRRRHRRIRARPPAAARTRRRRARAGPRHHDPRAERAARRDAGPADGGVPVASAEDVTVALSSLSTETLDPVLGGHVVKFYLDQIFDYLVGVTADGQLSADGGIATRWEPSPDHKRWTFQLRRGVKFHN